MSNRILVADDSKLVISLIKNIFLTEPEGYSIITAEDGNEALQKAQSEHPDLIMMDWEMPVMSGIDALVKLKADDKTKHIPVIMLTGSDNIAEAFEKGANDFVQKPFNKPELVTRVKTALQFVNVTKELKTKTIEIDIQKDKLKMQKDQLVRQKKDIIDSNDAAAKVQSLSFPSSILLDHCLPQHFILFQSKDELAHLTIKVWEKGNSVYLFLTSNNAQGVYSVMLNVASCLAVDSIIQSADENTLPAPGMIIDLLGKKLNEPVYLNPDGLKCMEALVVLFDFKKKIIQYSGVNKPFFVVKNDKIIVMKTDAIPDGLAEVALKPVNHKVQLNEKDVIYLVNDGFNNRRLAKGTSDYISVELSKVFIKIYGKPLDKQHDLLTKTFEMWKKDLRQEDDILVMGIKL